MKRFLPELTVLMVGVFALATARGENIVGELPTLENVERTWRASYASPHDKFQTVSRLIGKMKRYQSDGTKVDLAKSGEYLLSEILKTPVATPCDDSTEIAAGIFWMGMYLGKIAELRIVSSEPNNLMRIADKVGICKPLDDLSKTDALVLAHRLDSYVDWGTNKPPTRAGTVSGLSTDKPWFGPTGSRIAKIIDFRALYNQRVTAMRKTILRRYHLVIMSNRSSLSCDAQLKLWQEFVRRAGATKEELGQNLGCDVRD